jgi:hypothetical protein
MRTDPHDSSSDIHATIWTMIHGAAAGDVARRDQFAQVSLPLIRRYLGERWRGSPLVSELEDGAQEVFLVFRLSSLARETIAPRQLVNERCRKELVDSGPHISHEGILR